MICIVDVLHYTHKQICTHFISFESGDHKTALLARRGWLATITCPSHFLLALILSVRLRLLFVLQAWSCCLLC